MRRRFLVTYDVSDAKRLRRAFRALHGFGSPIQYSVFLCDLSAVERQLMKERLSSILNLREDRLLIVDLGVAGSRGAADLEVIGKALEPVNQDYQPMII